MRDETEKEGEDSERERARSFFQRATKDGKGKGETLLMAGAGPYSFSAKETRRWWGGRRVEAEGKVLASSHRLQPWSSGEKDVASEDDFLFLLDETRIRGFASQEGEATLELRSIAPPFTYVAKKRGWKKGFEVKMKADEETGTTERVSDAEGAERLLLLYETVRAMATPEGRQRLAAAAAKERKNLPFLPITLNDAVHVAVSLGIAATVLRALLKKKAEAHSPVAIASLQNSAAYKKGLSSQEVAQTLDTPTIPKVTAFDALNIDLPTETYSQTRPEVRATFLQQNYDNYDCTTYNRDRSECESPKCGPEKKGRRISCCEWVEKKGEEDGGICAQNASLLSKMRKLDALKKLKGESAKNIEDVILSEDDYVKQYNKEYDAFRKTIGRGHKEEAMPEIEAKIEALSNKQRDGQGLDTNENALLEKLKRIKEMIEQKNNLNTNTEKLEVFRSTHPLNLEALALEKAGTKKVGTVASIRVDKLSKQARMKLQLQSMIGKTDIEKAYANHTKDTLSEIDTDMTLSEPDKKEKRYGAIKAALLDEENANPLAKINRTAIQNVVDDWSDHVCSQHQSADKCNTRQRCQWNSVLQACFAQEQFAKVKKMIYDNNSLFQEKKLKGNDSEFLEEAQKVIAGRGNATAVADPSESLKPTQSPGSQTLGGYRRTQPEEITNSILTTPQIRRKIKELITDPTRIPDTTTPREELLRVLQLLEENPDQDIGDSSTEVPESDTEATTSAAVAQGSAPPSFDESNTGDSGMEDGADLSARRRALEAQEEALRRRRAEREARRRERLGGGAGFAAVGATAADTSDQP